MENQVKSKEEKCYTCHICQEMSNHPTKNCPNLVCKSCGQNGHAKKDCQKIRMKMIQDKRKGNIKKFNKTTFRGMIQDRDEGIFWTFSSKQEFNVKFIQHPGTSKY